MSETSYARLPRSNTQHRTPHEEGVVRISYEVEKRDLKQGAGLSAMPTLHSTCSVQICQLRQEGDEAWREGHAGVAVCTAAVVEKREISTVTALFA